MIVRARCRRSAGRLTTRDKWPCGEEGREETERQHNFMKPLTHNFSSMSLSTANTHTLCFQRAQRLGYQSGLVQSSTQYLSLLARVHKTSAPCCFYSLSLLRRTCVTFGVGRTHDLLNAEQVAKDKEHLTLLLPRPDVRNVSLSFFRVDELVAILFLSFFLRASGQIKRVFISTRRLIIIFYSRAERHRRRNQTGETGRAAFLKLLHQLTWRLCTAGAAGRCVCAKASEELNWVPDFFLFFFFLLCFHCFKIYSLIFSEVSGQNLLNLS